MPIGITPSEIVVTPIQPVRLDVTNAPTATVQIAGVAGPPGPQGLPAGVLQLTANTAIGGHRAVIAEANGAAYADHTDTTHAGRVLGVTAGAASAGNAVQIIPSGELVEPSWAWADGPVYLGTNGLLTQTPPTTGFVQMLGAATAPTKLMVAIGDPVILT